MPKKYTLITVQRLGHGLWTMIGHYDQKRNELITSTAANAEEAIRIAQRHESPFFLHGGVGF